MIHYGDITKISGYDVPMADVVTFGAPCQDLSVAGKREGMKHTDKGDDETTRSGLFHDAIRIIKEMREKDVRNGRTGEFIRPRFAVYENVPGAFSSNKGEDFKVVLEEVAKVIDKDAVIPMPPKNKWSTSGAILGDGWSIAWRVFDAQFWGPTYFDDAGMPIKLGTPQRRKRIALVADFGGQCASEILFERKSLRRDSSESGTERETASSDAEGSLGADDREGESTKAYTLKIRSGCEGGGKGALIQVDKSATLSTNNDQYLFQPTNDSGGKVYGFPLGFRPENVRLYNEKATTLCIGTRAGFCNGVVSKENTISFEPGIASREGGHIYESVSGTLRANMCDRDVKQNGSGWKEDKAYTLNTIDRHAVATNKPHYIVRRLTPMECERLQGFPDGWTDIGEYIDSKGKKKQSSDSARYKALGNSIALPPWKWVLKRICSHYDRDAFLVSLFDGIGGFPLIWEQLNGKGSAVWASEIEDFPIAVTKERIG